MSNYSSGCAILADRHLELAEGVRGLLEAVFSTVYVVADIGSLLEGAERLSPALITLDIALASGNIALVVEQVRQAAPGCRLVILTVHDQQSAPRLSLAAGANGIVLKRTIGSDLLPAIEAVMAGKTYVSPGFDLPQGSAGNSQDTD